MKEKIIYQAWIIAPCVTLIIVAVLAAIVILGSVIIAILGILKLIKFLIPIDRIKKKKKEIIKSDFDKDIVRLRSYYEKTS